MTKLLLVGLGSALGGMGRYLVTIGVATLKLPAFPWATLGINVVGSLLIGLFSGLLARGCATHPVLVEYLKPFAVVGLCGGFTTFSTFSNESLKLLESAHWGLAGLYMGLSVLAGIIAVILGYALAGRSSFL